MKGPPEWMDTVVRLVKRGFSLTVPYFCSAPEAQEQSCLLLVYGSPAKLKDSSQMSVPLPPNLLSPYTSSANWVALQCRAAVPRKSAVPPLLPHNMMDLGA